MNYRETVEYLYNQLPMFSRVGSSAFKKDLTNIYFLCAHLDDPHKKFRSIHVGGTNGKGSVSHILASIFQTAGYKTGLYTSPHLYDFRERIKINSEMVPETFVIDFVERIKPTIENIAPSFFEITVAMAFHYFAAEKVDIAIIEVGLGGRLDSTNIIQPELSVITNVGWDHTDMLGNSLEEIAAEKAGIIKKNTPVVIGERNAVTDPVFSSVALQNNARVYFATDKYSVQEYRLSLKSIDISVNDHQANSPRLYNTDLPGIYQTKNLLTVLQAVQLLAEWKIGSSTLHAGLEQVKKMTGLSGRWELIHDKPSVILEAAHNKNGIEQMLHHLSQIKYNRLRLVMGMVKDKDITGILSLLPKHACYYFTEAHSPRALKAASLKEQAASFLLDGNACPDVNTALDQAICASSENDLIVVFGSIYLIAEVKRPANF